MALSAEELAALGIGPGHYAYPDYQSLIASDPTYLSQVGPTGTISNQEKAATDLRANTIKSLITGFGDPSMLTGGGGAQARGVSTNPFSAFLAANPNLAGDIDPATLAAAQANTHSTLAEAALSNSRNVSGVGALQAGRGTLYSGAYAGGLRRQQENYDRTNYQNVMDLLTKMGGAGNDWLTSWLGLQDQRQAALAAAGDRVRGLYPGTWMSDANGNPVPGGSGTPTSTGGTPTDTTTTDTTTTDTTTLPDHGFDLNAPPTVGSGVPTPGLIPNNPNNYGGVQTGLQPGEDLNTIYDYVAAPPKLTAPDQYNINDGGYPAVPTPNITGSDPNYYGGVQSGLQPGEDPNARYSYVDQPLVTPPELSLPPTPNTTGADVNSYGGVLSGYQQGEAPGTVYPYVDAPLTQAYSPYAPIQPTPNMTGADPNSYGGVLSPLQPGEDPGTIYNYVDPNTAPQLIAPPQYNIIPSDVYYPAVPTPNIFGGNPYTYGGVLNPDWMGV